MGWGVHARGQRWLAACFAVVLSFGETAHVHGQPSPPAPCTRRVMQVVAHPDDDLLFMNPDVQRDVDGGRCVRTVYLTAGDSGLGPRHWERREAGARAAYATLAGVADRWSAGAAPGTTIPLRTLAANPNVSLVFLRLPDGARGGEGFPRTGGAGLRKLWEGDVAALATVDAARPVTYTKAGLVATLSALLREFRPDTVRVQDSVASFEPHDDHSDHRAAARFAIAAQATYALPHDLVSYAGYETEHRPANVSGAALRAKKAAFYAYAGYDRSACDSDRACRGKYAAWLRRQYAMTPATAALRTGDGRCADLAGGSRTPGTRVVAATCGDRPAQAFGHERGEIRALGSTCLDGGAGAVTVQPCTGARTQVWRLTPDGELRDDGGRCLTARGRALVVAPCDGGTRQRWRLGT